MIEMMLMAQFDTAAAITPAVSKVAEPVKQKSTIDAMFEGVQAFGSIRAAWIDHNAYLDNQDTTATAIGGRFGFDTAVYKGLQVHAAATAGFNVGGLSPEHTSAKFNPEYTGDKTSFIYLSEASIAYSNERFALTAGRISIDTPYADSDDIRMAANTFEGAVAALQARDDLSLTVAYLNRWAGFDSADAQPQEEFKPLVSSDSYGALAVAFSKSFGESSELSVWYYDVDNLASILYGEYAGSSALADALELEYALQASAMSERAASGVKGAVYGASAALAYKGLTFSGAYNRADTFGAGVLTDGFGGGPYMTSMDEMTLGALSEMAPGETLGSYLYGMGYTFEKGALSGLGVEYAHAEFESADATAKVREDNLVASYETGEHWTLEAVYAQFNDLRTADDRFDRAYMRIDYNF